MFERSGMPYDVVAYETDELAMLLNETEEGLFHRMLRKSWVNGSIPADQSSLAALIRTLPKTLKRAWPKIAPLWHVKDGEPDRLINRKQERERAFVHDRQEFTDAQSARQAAKGRKSAEVQRAKREAAAATTVEPRLNHGSTVVATGLQPPSQPVPSQPVPTLFGEANTEDGSSPEDSPATGKRAGRVDPTMDHFAERCMTLTGAPYQFSRGDGVQMSILRQGYKIASGVDPPGWVEAVTNYFASPMGKYTLADLCVRYHVFKNSALDGFNKPIAHENRRNGGGGNSESKGEINKRAAERLRARWSAEGGGGGERDT